MSEIIKRNVHIQYCEAMLAAIAAHGAYTHAVIGKMINWGHEGPSIKSVVVLAANKDEIHCAYYTEDVTQMELSEAKDHMRCVMVASWDERDLETQHQNALNTGECSPYGGYTTRM